MLLLGAIVGVAVLALLTMRRDTIRDASGKVIVRMHDRRVKITEVQFWPWTTNYTTQDMHQYSRLESAEFYFCKFLRKFHIAAWPHQSADLCRLTGPEWDPQDALAFFANGRHKGAPRFELVNAQGRKYTGDCGDWAVSFGIAPRRMFLTNEFIAVVWLPPHTGGDFTLRFEGETNDLAEVTLR